MHLVIRHLNAEKYKYILDIIALTIAFGVYFYGEMIEQSI